MPEEQILQIPGDFFRYANLQGHWKQESGENHFFVLNPDGTCDIQSPLLATNRRSRGYWESVGDKLRLFINKEEGNTGWQTKGVDLDIYMVNRSILVFGVSPSDNHGRFIRA